MTVCDGCGKPILHPDIVLEKWPTRTIPNSTETQPHFVMHFHAACALDSSRSPLTGDGGTRD